MSAKITDLPPFTTPKKEVIVPYDSKYPAQKTSVFVNDVAKVLLNRQLLQVQRTRNDEGKNQYRLLVEMDENDMPCTISQVKIDTEGRLLEIRVVEGGCCVNFGCGTRAKGYTA